MMMIMMMIYVSQLLFIFMDADGYFFRFSIHDGKWWKIGQYAPRSQKRAWLTLASFERVDLKLVPLHLHYRGIYGNFLQSKKIFKIYRGDMGRNWAWIYLFMRAEGEKSEATFEKYSKFVAEISNFEALAKRAFICISMSFYICKNNISEAFSSAICCEKVRLHCKLPSFGVEYMAFKKVSQAPSFICYGWKIVAYFEVFAMKGLRRV